MIFKHCEKCLFTFELSFVLLGLCISNLVFSIEDSPIQCNNEDDEKFAKSSAVMVVDVGDASLKIQWIVWMMHATNEFCRGLQHRTN